MKISFHGACREVTGSCHLVETETCHFLVDCGMFQGGKFAEDKNFAAFSFDPAKIDFVLLTHAHMDHCGRLPKLYRDGFRGQIYCTAPTKDFTEIMLLDSAHVLAEEASRHNHPPLYQEADVHHVIGQCEVVPYHQAHKINDTVSVRLFDAGHILGSAIFEISITQADGSTKKLVFSGDLGNPPAPIVGDTEFIAGADVVVIESTYANKVHESADKRVELLRQAVVDTVQRGGALLIPAFALERTQEVLYELNGLVEHGHMPRVPIFVDSPLAIAATKVYKKYANFYDAESRALVESGDDLFNFPGLIYTRTVEESKKINVTPAPKVIMAGGGMCNGGRIVHHIKFNIANPKNHLLLISYQPEGSIGRQMLEGVDAITVLNERLPVRASISAIGAYSSHADQPKLVNWLKQITQPKPTQVFIVHGEIEGNQAMAQQCQLQGLNPTIPEYGATYTI